jgi:hypothetical protein
MKKIILFCFICFSHISCSNNDDAPATNLNPNTLLLKKTVSSMNGDDPVTTIWNYNGMKLANTISSDGFSRNYTYTGNLITKIDEINGDLAQSYLFAYDEEQRLVAISGNQAETFDYNANGTVTHNVYYPDDTLRSTAIIYLADGEISRIETDYADAFSTIYEYIYDNKFVPTRNITGFDKIYLAMYYPYGRYKNVTARSYSDSDGVQGQVNKVLAYNSVGFPVTVHSTDDQMIDSYGTQFFYE